MEDFKYARSRTLIVVEMIIYGGFLLWFLYHMVPLGFK